ncbi:MAG: mechanosensitive ion channel family protein [Candidatus Micrarchaeia archaeon]
MDVFTQLGQFDWNSFIPFIIALAVAYVVAKFVNFALKKAAKQFVGKTKTVLDDLLLEALDLPIALGLGCAGLYVAGVVSGFDSIPLFWAILKELALVVGAFSAYKIFAAVLRWYVVEIAPVKKLPLADMETTFRRLAGLFIFSMAAIMMLDTAGVEVSPLLASLGIAGLAVALAFQDTLGNFFAGVYISLDRPIREGDYIMLEGGYEGYVQKIGWRSTQIRLLSNNIVVVPNSKLASSVITNYYSPDKALAVLVPVSVAYGSDLEKVERITNEVAEKMQQTVKGADSAFKPFIRYGSFGDSGINFNVIMRANEFTDRFLLTHEFIKALHKRFAKEKVEIPYPKRDVYVHRRK